MKSLRCMKVVITKASLHKGLFHASWPINWIHTHLSLRDTLLKSLLKRIAEFVPGQQGQQSIGSQSIKHYEGVCRIWPSGTRSDLFATCSWGVSNKCALQYCSYKWHQAAEAWRNHFCNTLSAGEKFCRKESTQQLPAALSYRHQTYRQPCWHHIIVHR